MDINNIVSVEVNLESNPIESNTADLTQVKIVYKKQLDQAEYSIDNGQKIKSDTGNLSIEEVKFTNLGTIKTDIENTQVKIDELVAYKQKLESILTLVQPKVDKVIDDKVKDGSAVDNRTDVISVNS